MANPEKVTVDKAYFDALLRRAGFHTKTQLLGRQDPANISISRTEYDSLLRICREYDTLKNSLYQGGITGETLDLPLPGAPNNDMRKDSGIDSTNSWTKELKDQSGITQSGLQSMIQGSFQDLQSKAGAQSTMFNLAPGSGPYRNGNLQPQQNRLRIPSLQRQVSYGMSSVPEDTAFDDDDEFVEGHQLQTDFTNVPDNTEKRTLYFCGLPERTTYRDLLSIVTGGKVLSVNLRPERSATVTFLDGAADFLAWAKRNDIYLHTKRIEVKWADRQYNLNGHVASKIANGATRNLVINSALEKGLTELQIREDMDHIHNLITIDVVFRGGDAFVSMNSVHNALFARTCMMSRSTYKGCKIEFFHDECDVPLPVRKITPRTAVPAPAKKKPAITNRFDMLNFDGKSASSGEVDRTPSDYESEDESLDVSNNVGVSLKFLDSHST